MKIKNYFIVAMTLVFGVALLSSCGKDNGILTPKVTENSVVRSGNKATFAWYVDWPGKKSSVVEISQNEDMSGSQSYGSEVETENSIFSVDVNGLQDASTYFYRYVVWNREYENNKYRTEVKVLEAVGGSAPVPDAPQAPTGAVNGLFSVSASETVWFSQGNLQYIGSASTPYWKFADHQWAVLGNGSQASAAPNVDRDLFGWGTSGYHDGGDPYNVNYQPYSTSTSTVNSSYNNYGYGPSTNQSNPNIAGTHYDWGVHNKIANGGNQAGLWRTLTKAEWVYVFNTREASTVNGTPNARYAKAKVNDVHGVILFPDSYTHPSGVSAPFGINETGDTGWNYNVYGAEDWSKMEEQGCVFLPAAGYRNGTSVNNVGSGGYYWSASYYSEGNAYDVWFNDSNLSPQSYNMRDNGQSVRLVRSAQ